MTIYLYNIVRAIFYIARNYLIKQGFLSLTLTGTDLSPVTDMYPQLAYRRSLSVSFKNSFDAFLDIEEPLAQRIAVAIGVHHPNVSDVDDVDRTVISTEFDVS